MKAKRLIITSSGTSDKQSYSAQHFHREAVQAGYSRCNHHFVITRDGIKHDMRLSDEPSLSLVGTLKKYNMDSQSVLLVGTKDYTEKQLATLYLLLIAAMADGLDIISHSNLCLETGLEDSGKPGLDLHTLIEERADDHG